MAYSANLKKPYQTLVGWYGKRTVVAVGILIITLGITAVVIAKSVSSQETPTAAEQKKTVTVRRVSELASADGEFSVVGSIASVSEARLQTEAAGRVTSVNAAIGDTVAAGKILAALENSREAAAVLQAEGLYDAAVAAAESSDIGLGQSEEDLDSAEQEAMNASRNAFIVVDSVMKETIDAIFTDYNRQVFGFGGFSVERRNIGYALKPWGESTLTSLSPTDLDTALGDADAIVSRATIFVDALFEELIKRDRSLDATYDPLIADVRAALTSARSDLASARTTIINAKSELKNTRAAFEKAQVASSEGKVSAADAQVKQALGSLRAAQAAYEKTLVRSPIAGVVNAFYLKTNEYVGMNTPAAIVANNSALEITTSVSEDDRASISVSDIVRIDGGTGVITHIAPAIDPTSGKIEVRISVNSGADIKNGDTVPVVFARNTSAVEEADAISLSLSTFKITPDGPVAFTVDQDGMLVAHKVTLGAIAGDRVIVKEGITPDMEIVTDARGLREGEIVDVTR